MQFYFIRHAQSVNNALWDTTGSSLNRSQDPELSEIGRKQATLLGEYLSRKDHHIKLDSRDPQNLNGFRFTHLYCSLMLRAIQTGYAISNATRVPLTAWIDAHEEGGIYLEDETTGLRKGYPGVTRSYLAKNYPTMRLPESLTDLGWWNRPFEDAGEREDRARRFLDELLERHGGSDDRVAVVSHGGFYNLLMHVLMGRALDGRAWFSLNNAAITRIDFIRDMVITYMNRVDYLPAELIT